MVLFGGHQKFEQTGTLAISASVSLTIWEPLTRQLLWKKEIRIPEPGQRFSIYYWQEQITNKKGEVMTSRIIRLKTMTPGVKPL